MQFIVHIFGAVLVTLENYGIYYRMVILGSTVEIMRHSHVLHGCLTEHGFVQSFPPMWAHEVVKVLLVSHNMTYSDIREVNNVFNNFFDI